MADGRHWLHEATYWLRHEANAELNVLLPAPGRVVAASVDGIEVSPLQPDPSRLWLPLPRQSGVRWVRLRWIYDDEPLTAPHLDKPTLEDARDGPSIWTLHAPDGFRMERTGGTQLRSGVVRAAALDLYRAEAQAQIVKQLASEFASSAGEGSTRAELTAAQRRFFQYCRQAEHLLVAAPPRGTEETGPQGQPLEEWLAKLLEQNRDVTKNSEALEEIRSEAARLAEQVRPIRPIPEHPTMSALIHAEGARFAGVTRTRVGAGGTALPERGTPFGGQGGPEASAPVLVLTPIAERETRLALLGAGWWLALLVTLWILTLFPSLLKWTRPFWPEQLVLLGAFGWYLAGPRLVVLALLLAWTAVRLVRVSRLGVRLWNLWTANPEPTPISVVARG